AKCVAAAGATAIVFDVPVSEAVVVSDAVIVWLPAVRRVAENVPVPLDTVESAGSDACASLAVNWRVPEYAVAVLLNWSRAVTVKPKALPAVAADGVDTAKCVAAAGLTAIEADVPVMLPLPASVAVTVCEPAVSRVALKVPVPFERVEFAGRTAS